MSLSGSLSASSPFGNQDYAVFCQKVEDRFRIKLGDYKPEQMSRRVSSLARQLGCPSFFAYFGLIEKDAHALDQFLDLMTINVTELFRNPLLFQQLADRIAASQGTRDGSAYSVWSAGCSYGAEAYTMAIILEEILGGRPYRVRGTDVDLAILAKANSPSFTEADMANVSKARREAHFNTPDGTTYLPKLALRRNVTFTRHDLLSGEYMPSQYDLILCRNVVIYFTDEAKERIYEGFFQSLKPGGILFVGGTERIATASKIGFETVEPFVYRRPATVGVMKKAA
jgi:chemotaxis protein methyltransferase CheR